MDETHTDKRDQQSLPRPFSQDWWKLARRATWIASKDLYRDHGPFWAAAIAYYAIFSVIPLLILATVAASFFVDPGWAVDRITDVFGELLPEGEEELEQLVQQTYDGRGVAGLASIGALLWSGTRLFGTMAQSLNISYDVPEVYGWLRRFLVELLMLLSLGVLLMVALGSSLLIEQVYEITGLGESERALLLTVLRYTLPFALVVLAFALIYRFVPRRRPHWTAALVGGLIATTLYFLAQRLFFEYLERFGEFETMYGPLGLLIVIIFWFWIGAYILLYGGELVSHYQDILIDGMDPDDVEGRHEREEPTREAEE